MSVACLQVFALGGDALGGAIANVLFVKHFQIRRLERRCGEDLIQSLYCAVARDQP